MKEYMQVVYNVNLEKPAGRATNHGPLSGYDWNFSI